MSTPTPSTTRHPPPNQHAAAMTPGSFANHLAAFSPLPTTGPSSGGSRSVPSPAYLAAHPSRSQKSPLPLHLQSSPPSTSNPTSGIAAFATPNVAINYDSPNAAATMGLNLGNIGTLESLGAGNGAVSVNARGDEHERRRRTGEILSLLRTRPGRISEEGVERLAKRIGLDCLWDNGIGGRTLSIAGETILVEVDFKSNAIERLALTLPTSPDVVTVHAPKAATILQRDLTPPLGVSSMNTTLTAFANNLERLASLDRLSTSELNCYEAISGVYTSLKRVFDYEKTKIPGSSDSDSTGTTERDGERAEKETMCKRSGRPSMHSGRRVGLSLKYWTERRLALSRHKRSKDVEAGAARGIDDAEGLDGSKTWSVVIDCEASPAELYPSIRISEDWVSRKVEAPQDQDNPFRTSEEPIVDWLEPPQTLLPLSSSQGESMTLDPGETNMSKLPDVRFVARLDPPVVVPLQTAVAIYGTVGTAIADDSLRMTTYDGLVIPPDHADPALTPGDARKLERQATVTVRDKEGRFAQKPHRNTLYAQKPDYGRTIEEIPFSHPRQLIAILLMLRQFAFLGNLLQKSFPKPAMHTSESVRNSELEKQPSADQELEALLGGNDAMNLDPNSDTPLPLDISVITQPTPKITLVFPMREKVANLTFEISQNGNISVVDQNLISEDTSNSSHEEGKSNKLTKDGIGRALEISEDLGILVEFLKQRLE
ncbi:MAG: hypothetical protein M1827_003712 [Pycnora praestabilis]|nr:MAG: hypothetical protein M1827_003712 [Pycnora praestabilis]